VGIVKVLRALRQTMQVSHAKEQAVPRRCPACFTLVHESPLTASEAGPA